MEDLNYCYMFNYRDCAVGLWCQKEFEYTGPNVVALFDPGHYADVPIMAYKERQE